MCVVDGERFGIAAGRPALTVPLFQRRPSYQCVMRIQQLEHLVWFTVNQQHGFVLGVVLSEQKSDRPALISLGVQPCG